ncbi:MAG: hypothetical protein IIB25_09985 [Chloroflexi bacterium]|nr:hypothetical protein [Chloroflexota bacterium]
MNKRITSAVTALITDNSLLSRFRRNPAAAMRRFRLSECELDALKSGDEQALLAHGLASELITGRPQAPHWFGGLVATVARRMAAPALIAVMLALAVQSGGIPTASAGRADARFRMRSMRDSGPLGLRRATGRARVRTHVEAIRARVRGRSSSTYRAGIRTARAQLGDCKCTVIGTAD